MKVFVIHRHSDRAKATKFVKDAKKSLGISLDPILLNNSSAPNWKARAEEEIRTAELVLVFDTEACSKSENAEWEIEIAGKLSKPIVEFNRRETIEVAMEDLKLAYNFENEFDECFSVGQQQTEGNFELFKIMVETSEELIRRRQITNGFFITIIGGLLAGSGFALKEKLIADEATLLLLVPTVLGMLLCWSWRNLIDNYGKLNKAKFKVINKLEMELSSRVFSAEWIALGKGVRKEKYRSFTETEKNVPLLFMMLLFLVAIYISLDWLWPSILSLWTQIQGISHPP
ncbi:RipA family octameric membrane protein [Litoreibacter janthinus]|uniref:TIR domain-containing protein n=1 Tax=Litoreibacter janthinus TaxID=670154 RepID=A0A1I6HG16_9RHOB|nr:TIR domain-containing protein [Litoreibacter janthinus]SFR53433.1 TIR domain-containing protein [Litoreibacter janthinus]